MSLLHIFKQLDFGDQKPWKGSPKPVGAAETETTMIWYTSRIADRIPSIETFFINDDWNIQEWINTHELHGAKDRDMAGTLEFMPSNNNLRYNTARYRSQKY